MPLIAPYVRVSYTALHTYRSTQTLIQSIRVDQARSALAFISPVHFWRGKHLGAEKVVEDGLALLRTSIDLTLSSNFAFALSVGLHSQPLLLFQNVKPKNVLFIGLATLVLAALTLRRNLRPSQLLTDAITLSAAISLLTKMSKSSA